MELLWNFKFGYEGMRVGIYVLTPFVTLRYIRLMTDLFQVTRSVTASLPLDTITYVMIRYDRIVPIEFTIGLRSDPKIRFGTILSVHYNTYITN